MFDKNFVAGKAAISRFEAKGIITAADFFEVVGRPQLSEIEVVDRPKNDAKQPMTVLYAPTWYGIGSDAHYSSQEKAPQIIDELLNHHIRVIYRSHPLSRTDGAMGVGINWAKQIEQINDKLRRHRDVTGTEHIFGIDAEEKMSVYDCFNKADVLITDISSVASDFLYSQKPYAVFSNIPSTDQFMKDNPITKGAYVLDHDLSNLPQIIEQFKSAVQKGDDPQKKNRLELKKFYLGDFSLEKSGEDYTEVFLETLRKYLV
jgi:CDP-glycerol glycerophosphotransferase (TagB/SpsB family)